MLHENPLMADIDVNHWRNMQSLLLDSAKAKRRIIIIHEEGEILKFVHSDQVEILKNVTSIDDPKSAAKKVFEANQGKAEFVVVLERRSVEKYFAQVQDSWRADEDLDVYVHRMFATLDEYADGLVTYPDKARNTIGLQWRVGAEYEDIRSTVASYIPANTTVLLGVFEGDTLWGSLILSFDGEKRIDSVTTVDPTELNLSGKWEFQTHEIVKWVNQKFTPCSLALFTDVANARIFLKNKDKGIAFQDMVRSGKLLVEPLPQALAAMMVRQ
jgi:hypothetical protein